MSVTNLTISDSVETIGNRAFAKYDENSGSTKLPNDWVTNLTISADTLQKYLDAKGGFSENANITCTSGDCMEILSAWDTANNTNYTQNTRFGFKNTDGSLSIYKNGSLVGYKGKRIYTIDEANAVAGEKNRVSIKYR